MSDRKISNFSVLTGSGVDVDNDYVEILDASASVADRNKRIAVAELVARTSTFTPSGTGAVSTDLQTRGRLIVYATDYGSKMVTTPCADINAAITYVNSVGGGTVVVPAGSYTAETSALHKSNVILMLYGVTLTAATGLNAPIIKNATTPTSVSVSSITRSTTVATVTTATAHGFATDDWVHIAGADQYLEYDGWHKVTVTGTTAFTFVCDKDATTPATGTITCYKSTERNLTIIGGKLVGNAANTVGSNNGIYYEGVRDYLIQDVFVDGTTHMGILVNSGLFGKIRGDHADNVTDAQHCGICLGGSSPTLTYVEATAVSDCHTNYNGQDGILLQCTRGCTATGNMAYGNGLSGIKLGGVSARCTVTGNHTENNRTGIKAQGAWSDIAITGNTCRMNKDNGISIENQLTTINGTNIAITGNVCDNNGNDPSSASYGISLQPSASCTIDRILVASNVVTNNSRGISVSATGTVSHLTLVGNKGGGNLLDVSYGAALDATTFFYGLNDLSNTAAGIGLLPTSASGIYLGNTDNTDTTVLDHYVEGSWTPVLTFATPGDVSVTYAQQIGRYTRTGNRVILTCHILTSAFTFTTASGQLRITGSPYTSLNVSNFTQVGAGAAWQGITKANYTHVYPFMTANSAIINLGGSGSGQSIAVISTGDTPSAGTVQISFTMLIVV